MKKVITGKKRIITRIILIISIIIFGILWKPEKYSTQIMQYIIVGNIALVFLLMELLPLRFRHQYRVILKFLNHFAEVYDDRLVYSYTPVVVIKSDIRQKSEHVSINDIVSKSGKIFFSIYHKGKNYEFITDITDHRYIIDLASVIVYYLQRDIPYELLYEHTKHIVHTLKNN